MRLRTGGLAALVGVLTLCMITFTAVQTQRSRTVMREQMLAQAEQRALQLADSTAGEVQAVLAGIDHSLLALRWRWARRDPADFEARLRADLHVLQAGVVSRIEVFDGKAQRVFDSLAPSAGKDSATHLGATGLALPSDDRLTFGPPTPGAAASSWSLTLLRPLQAAGGSEGAVAVTVPAQFFSDRLASVRRSDGDIATLIAANGVVLARSSDSWRAIGQTVPADRPYLVQRALSAGSYRQRSSIDGVERLYAWRRLPGSGVIVLVGFSQQTVLQPLNAALAREGLIGGFSMLVLGALGGAVALLLLRLGREQRAAAASQMLRQRLFESSQVAINVVDAHAHIVDCNPAAAQLFGWPDPQALIGHSVAAMSPPVQPDGTRSDASPYPARALGQGSTVFEWRHRRPDGQLWDAEVHMLPFESDGRTLLQCTMRDVTERKTADRALRLLEFAIDTTCEEVIYLDSTGRIIGVNRQTCENLGMAASEIVGGHVWDIDPDFGPDQVAAIVARLRVKRWERFEGLHRRKDGSTYPVEVSSNLFHFDGQDYTISFSRDISERKRNQQQLERENVELEQRVRQRTAELLAAKNEAERANRAKSEFLSRMSHELRTPLNAVLGFSQLIVADGRVDALTGGRVQEILRAGQHLLELINEVLDLARVESGAMSVSPEPVAMGALLAECLALLQPMAQARGVLLPLENPACDAMDAKADRTRLRQVVLNLLGNAIKYNRPGGRVELECAADADDAQWLRLVVRDQGAGLTPAQQSRLFVPFERLDADHRQIEGTGIGLALSKRLVELMGGALGVQSVPGEGSAFWIRVPRALPGDFAPTAAPAPLAATAAAVAAAVAQCSQTAARHLVLCIEDNPANLHLLESVFARRSDILLLTAATPGAGLELARTRQPALILLDINLPGMDGYTVMGHLREDAATRDIPVLAVSANAMTVDIERARAAGFADYLTKPLDLPHLLHTIDRLLAR